MIHKHGWIGAAALLSGSFSVAHAQTEEEASTEPEVSRQLDTVYVTATKREQTLQEVPIAVSVVDGEDILKAQIVDIFDLQSLVPSLRVSQLERATNSTFIIRGFGNGGNNIGIEPSVAVFVDGVFRPRSSGSLGDFPDVERVEVLRGPQSTLFGKNASAGVVAFVTSAPSFEWGGKVEATLGNYNQRIGKVYFTGPLSDNVAFSLAGSVNQQDGYVDNLETGADINNRDRSMVRGQLLFEPNDNLSVRLIGDWDKLDELCCYAPNFFNGPTGAAVAGLGGTVPDDPFSYNTYLNYEPTNVVENSGFSGQVDLNLGWADLTSITAIRNQDSATNGDVDFTSAQLVTSNNNIWEIETFTQEFRLAGGTESLDWLVGAFYYDESLEKESDVLWGPAMNAYANILSGGLTNQIQGLLGAGTFFGTGTGTVETFTHDNQSYNLFGQVDWNATDRFTLTLGVGYVNDEKTVNASTVNTDLFAGLDLAGIFSNADIVTNDVLRALDLVALSGGALPVQFDEAVFGQTFTAVTMQPATAENIGALQAAAAAGDPTALGTLQAIQQTIPLVEPAVGDGIRAALAPGVAGALAPLQIFPPFVSLPNSVEDNSTNDDHVSYTVRGAYDVTDNINVYASYATGYKASSWNLTRDSTYFPEDEAALRAAGLIPNNRGSGTRFAGPEEVETFELGLKAEFDRATVNLAIFDQTIEGFQSVIFQGTGFVLANAGEQKATGIEIDATWNPIDPLTLGFSGLFLDPEYVDFQDAPGVGGPTDLSGETPGGIHTTSLSFGAQWEDEIAPGILGFIKGDYQYEDDIQVIDNVPEEVLSREVNMLNASIGAKFDNGLEATFWGRNITGDEYSQSGFPTAAQEGSFNGYPNRPETYGITVRKSW